MQIYFTLISWLKPLSNWSTWGRLTTNSWSSIKRIRPYWKIPFFQVKVIVLTIWKTKKLGCYYLIFSHYISIWKLCRSTLVYRIKRRSKRSFLHVLRMKLWVVKLTGSKLKNSLQIFKSLIVLDQLYQAAWVSNVLTVKYVMTIR